MMMINICKKSLAWDERFKPRDFKDGEKESFSAWWLRNNSFFEKLGANVSEQWIYRHWKESHYNFLPLNSLYAGLEEWSTFKIVKEVGIWDNGLTTDEGHEYCLPTEDFEHSIESSSYEPFFTMRETGSWDLPILILSSPGGFIFEKGKRPDIKYWLIEGHKRFRTLYALNSKNRSSSSHKVHVLRYQ